jgi:hypothetical protein
VPEVIRRRKTCLGVMERRIGTPERHIRIDPDPRQYWIPELESGKPHIRYKATYQHPKRGKWGTEETREDNYGLLHAQQELAQRMLGR